MTYKVLKVLGMSAAIATAFSALPAIAQSLTVASKLPGKVHLLPATLETTQWGWFDNAQPPVLTVDSGDTVVMETMMHAHNQIVPGKTIEELKKLRTDHPGRGPHTLTGPIFVNGAEPGDVLKITINRIVAHHADKTRRDLQARQSTDMPAITPNRTNFKNAVGAFFRNMESLFVGGAMCCFDGVVNWVKSSVRRFQKVRPGRAYPRKSMKPINKWQAAAKKMGVYPSSPTTSAFAPASSR